MSDIDHRQLPDTDGKTRRMVVIQTVSGKEEVLHTYFEKIDAVQDLILETFYPRRQVKKRYRGEWKTVTEKLFPGYLFIDTRDSQALYQELKRIPVLSRILGDKEADFITLSQEEEAFIRRIGKNRGDHSIGISTVRIESDVSYKKGDRVSVVSGDLKDFEGEIIGFDFRKRKAMIQTGLFGGTVIHVGIELLRSM